MQRWGRKGAPSLKGFAHSHHEHDGVYTVRAGKDRWPQQGYGINTGGGGINGNTPQEKEKDSIRL